MTFKIAIDGPSGAGKSSMAKEVAKKLGFIYIDTGALYRAVGLYVLRKGINSNDTDKICEVLPQIKITLKHKNGSQHVFLNDEDVTGAIRTPLASKYSSDVSAVPAVRKSLFLLQRELADMHNVVMDGRDIGTVVLPDADVKIFLTASAKERAKRRYAELCKKGTDVCFEDVLADMKQRDKNDSSRETAPLKKAEDAILLDTTALNYDQSLNKILAIIEEKRNNVL